MKSNETQIKMEVQPKKNLLMRSDEFNMLLLLIKGLQGKRPKHACWIIQKILKTQKYTEGTSQCEMDSIQMPNFRIKKLHYKLFGDNPKVPSRKVSCNNPGLPK